MCLSHCKLLMNRALSFQTDSGQVGICFIQCWSKAIQLNVNSYMERRTLTDVHTDTPIYVYL